jgi:phosphotransferase family enzyme
MTAPATVALAADPALPHRDVLLDVDAMRERLSSVLGIGARAAVGSMTLVRVNYQVGRSMRAVYRAEIGDVTQTIAARMFSGAKSGEVYRRSDPLSPTAVAIRGVAHDEAAGTVFWVFPNDRKITALEAVLDPSMRVPGVDARSITKRLVAYAPEKSATLVCDAGDRKPVAYAKVTAAYQAKRDCDTYASLHAGLDPMDARLRLPRPLGYTATHRTLWLEAIHGRRLAECDDQQEIADLERLGAAVAAFHGLRVPDAPRFDRFSASNLADDATIVRTIRPDVAPVIDDLAQRLIATIPADRNFACLHGDLHPKNAILCADRLALIDVEDVATGPAAADLGSMIASLLYRRETGDLSRQAYWSRLVSFLVGYTAHRCLPSRASLAWHTAAALFVERAARAVTRIRPLGLAHLSALLAIAHSLLDAELEAL